MLTFYQDLQDDTSQIDISALRCTICGEVIDPLILQNRRSPPPNLLYGTKQTARDGGEMEKMGG